MKMVSAAAKKPSILASNDVVRALDHIWSGKPGICQRGIGGSIAFTCINGSTTVPPTADIFYPLATPLTFTSLFLSASSTADELTAMPADAIPLSEIQFADCNWSIEEAVYDAPEADANGVIDTLHQCTGQMRIQYSLDAAEQIDTLQKEYEALEARVTALENA